MIHRIRTSHSSVVGHFRGSFTPASLLAACATSLAIGCSSQAPTTTDGPTQIAQAELANSNACTGSITAVAGAAGAPVVVTSSSTCDFDVWVNRPGIGWGQLRDFGPSASPYSWDTTGVSAGSYQIVSFFRTLGSTIPRTTGVDGVSNTVTFSLAGESATKITLTAMPSGGVSGSTVNLAATGTFTAGYSPVYAFWVDMPGTGWRQLRDFAASSTFAWDTTAYSGGVSYPLIVFVKKIGATAVDMQSPVLTYALGGSGCSAATLAANKPSPVSSGTLVTLTSGATCTGGIVPMYSVWINRPGIGWGQLSTYSTSPTFTWDTTNFGGGLDYQLETFVRPQGSTGSAQAMSGSISMVVTGTSGGGASIGPAPVSLGLAGTYALLAKTGISTIPDSVVTGDIGLSPAASTFLTGFSMTRIGTYWTSTQVTGKLYGADNAVPTPSILTTSTADMETAYTDAAGRPTPNFLNLGVGAIGGRILAPGLYKWTTTVTIGSNVIISGSATDTWIFQISGDLTEAPAVRVTLLNGALAKNIVWQVAGAVSMGTTAHMEGIVLSKTNIALGTGASINGRLLAQTAISLDHSTVTAPAP